MSNSRSAHPPDFSTGGIVKLQPFDPFDMLQPHSIYNPKGAGAFPCTALFCHPCLHVNFVPGANGP